MAGMIAETLATPGLGVMVINGWLRPARFARMADGNAALRPAQPQTQDGDDEQNDE